MSSISWELDSEEFSDTPIFIEDITIYDEELNTKINQNNKQIIKTNYACFLFVFIKKIINYFAKFL